MAAIFKLLKRFQSFNELNRDLETQNILFSLVCIRHGPPDGVFDGVEGGEARQSIFSVGQDSA